MEENKYNIFVPTNNRELLVNKYKELGRMSEFAKLMNDDLLFVWHYSCKSSDIYKRHPNDPHSRAVNAAKVAYPDLDMSNKKYRDCCNLVFPDNIKIAIERMGKFDPSRRGRALEAIEKAYDTYIEILEAPLPGYISKEVEVDGIMTRVYEDVTPSMLKAIIETKSTAAKEISQIVPLLEEGFGLSMATGKKDGKTSVSDADEYISELRLTTKKN